MKAFRSQAITSFTFFAGFCSKDLRLPTKVWTESLRRTILRIVDVDVDVGFRRPGTVAGKPSKRL